MKLKDKIIKSLLVIVLVVAICSVVYLVVIHNPGEGYTEFYLLDANGNISDYPNSISQYSVNKFYICISNHENQEENYTIKIKQNNTTLNLYNKTLKNNEVVKTPYYFDTTSYIGDNQTLDIYLYKNNESAPYRSLNIKYNVTN